MGISLLGVLGMTTLTFIIGLFIGWFFGLGQGYRVGRTKGYVNGATDAMLVATCNGDLTPELTEVIKAMKDVK